MQLPHFRTSIALPIRDFLPSLKASPKTAPYSLALQLLPRHELREVERGDGAAPPVSRGRALPGLVHGGVDYLLVRGSAGSMTTYAEGNRST